LQSALLACSQQTQKQSIEIAGKAYANGRKLHIPRILLSASMEFEAARSQEPRHVPALAQIHCEDERIKQSPWYREGMTTPLPEPDNKGKVSTKK